MRPRCVLRADEAPALDGKGKGNGNGHPWQAPVESRVIGHPLLARQLSRLVHLAHSLSHSLSLEAARETPTAAGWLLCFALGCGAATPPVEEPDDGSPGPEIAVSIRLVDASADDVPGSQASLVLIHRSGRRELTPLTSLAGVCTHAVPEQGEILRVSCWWAGAGAVLSARRDGDALIVTKREVDEETGPGDPEHLQRVELPRRAQLSPLTP